MSGWFSSAPSSAATPTDANAGEDHVSDGSKLKTFIGILKKFIGVSDLAAVRFSLPSQLLEPTPNLEYWNYLDSPSAFAAIGTADEPVDRMLEVLRFWFTKDLKYAKGKPCKPYNSCLGEFFRCNWETEDDAPRIDTSALRKSPPGSSSSSMKSAKSAIPAGLGSSDPRAASTVSVTQSAANPTKPVRISYLTEQTSHHPPVSAFYIDCPEKGLHAKGFDQITAKFTGTSIKVMPGEHNLGIFITVDRRDHETYQLTHPAAHLGGILTGALSVSVGDMCYITCPETKLKAILRYYNDGWLGRTTNKMEGIIFRYDPENDNKTQIKDVPVEDILIRLGGAWKEKIVFTVGNKPLESHPPEQQITIIDVAPLSVAPKVLPPVEKQLPNESLQLWSEVTKAIHAKQFGKATTVKQELEEAQREKAREREKKGETWTPVFFEQATDKAGKPSLTEKGREVLRRAQAGNWDMDGILE
ncbi:uncharacterized protein PODANS_5_8600 [Podospora anserina S mat+]|uniref:Oxysterol-binding protein n=1 Tax=Podospora anserina (strain S / ATCC MYA-4624 / DSM 980 / FGSC 10383) TaxID=515849 RepID=B2AL37_PODAN|nr:uncharacterized protein PODANS_5_8600 [Podospora anserina S mat+]CAP64585.1 unnamed protein product [Podospora anserina S mat+]CDP29982.1 Putative oxysterol-binding protein [Podospora anserina S mat+]